MNHRMRTHVTPSYPDLTLATLRRWIIQRRQIKIKMLTLRTTSRKETLNTTVVPQNAYTNLAFSLYLK